MSSEIDAKTPEEPIRASQWLAIGLALLAGLARLLPNTLNLTPMGALGLFVGARLRGRLAFMLPLVVLAVTDVLLVFLQDYPLVNPTTPFVYAGFLVNVLLGRLVTRTHSPLWIGGASLAASLQFFALTNFGFWLSGYYGLTLAGLTECFVKAVPFFRGTLAGDLLFTGLFFGLHALLLYCLSLRQQARTVS